LFHSRLGSRIQVFQLASLVAVLVVLSPLSTTFSVVLGGSLMALALVEKWKRQW
jgi:hypothetical protein